MGIGEKEEVVGEGEEIIGLIGPIGLIGLIGNRTYRTYRTYYLRNGPFWGVAARM